MSLSAGAIVGIVIGCTVGIILLILLGLQLFARPGQRPSDWRGDDFHKITDGRWNKPYKRAEAYVDLTV